jgi:23S rRNA pseudouridine955/2504/2580 synthase
MKGLRKGSVVWREIDEGGNEQRVDNYLLKILKGVPKSHIYRILHSGEVRVNSKRVQATYKLQIGDRLRIPPVAESTPKSTYLPSPKFELPIIFEDEHLLVIDKPSGIAVHGGSGISLGVIEQLRLTRAHAPFLELVHRLDRGTSGILLLAKKRSALTKLHHTIRSGEMKKTYLALVSGEWVDKKRNVRLSLNKYVTSAGERRVSVVETGQAAHTVFKLSKRYGAYSLLQAELKTGRTHQIRVHLAHLEFPILGDDKYGNFALNKSLSKQGLERMFLHAHRVEFDHPASGEHMRFESKLPRDLKQFVDTLK